MIDFKDISKKNTAFFDLKGLFKDAPHSDEVISDMHYITYDFNNKTAYIYLGKKEDHKKDSLKKIITEIINQNETGFNIIAESFVTDVVSESDIVEIFTFQEMYHSHDSWNKKTGKNIPKKRKEVNLIANNTLLRIYQKAKVEAMNVNLVRDLQIMPHNKLNSEIYEQYILQMFKPIPTIEVKSLTLEEMRMNNMNLFLGVNAGSAYKPKCIILKYKGDASSTDNIVYVGKGITFDSGGMNIKTMTMQGMKYDMSGSAIVAGALRTIASLQYKTNVTAVLMITDNMVSNLAIKPDDVLIAANGTSVEINNTDAEGRLVLADGLVYAYKNLNATKLVDVATLTGAMRVTLGRTYTGVWSTDDNEWLKFKAASEEANELVWRMPHHKDYLKYMKGSKTADLKNTCLDAMQGGSCTAAGFLKEFTNNLPYIHLDVAATAVIDEVATGIMVKTLVEYSKRK